MIVVRSPSNNKNWCLTPVDDHHKIQVMQLENVLNGDQSKDFIEKAKKRLASKKDKMTKKVKDLTISF